METVLVLGAGPVGLMHLAYLKMKGLKVIVTDFSGERLAVASAMGAEHILHVHELGQALEESTGAAGVDMAVECTGSKEVWEKSVHYVRRGGVVILFGGCPSGTRVEYDACRLHYDEITLIGSFHYTLGDVREAYRYISEKSADLTPLISGEFPLGEVEKAFNMLSAGRGIKYAIRP